MSQMHYMSLWRQKDLYLDFGMTYKWTALKEMFTFTLDPLARDTSLTSPSWSKSTISIKHDGTNLTTQLYKFGEKAMNGSILHGIGVKIEPLKLLGN